MVPIAEITIEINTGSALFIVVIYASTQNPITMSAVFMRDDKALVQTYVIA